MGSLGVVAWATPIYLTGSLPATSLNMERFWIMPHLSILDVVTMFATEPQAIAWFERARWRGTPTCTHCGNTKEITRPKREVAHLF